MPDSNSSSHGSMPGFPRVKSDPPSGLTLTPTALPDAPLLQDSLSVHHDRGSDEGPDTSKSGHMVRVSSAPSSTCSDTICVPVKDVGVSVLHGDVGNDRVAPRVEKPSSAPTVTRRVRNY